MKKTWCVSAGWGQFSRAIGKAVEVFEPERLSDASAWAAPKLDIAATRTKHVKAAKRESTCFVAFGRDLALVWCIVVFVYLIFAAVGRAVSVSEIEFAIKLRGDR
ncbi:hypothetical protein [uncultured Shimia sp.]|uniref:hypothetical protein n=1 Tax=uncultured Shimia sp. TaxID=573152 RepID=UPI002607C917|nr:hypothetical protein [uncultured Shimia sp.]